MANDRIMNFRVEIAAITRHYPLDPLFRIDFNDPNFNPLASNTSLSSSTNNAAPIDPYATWTAVESIPNSPEKRSILTGCMDGHLDDI
jgi:hypothetical protein